MANWQKIAETTMKAASRANEIAGKFSDNSDPPKPDEDDIRLDVIEVKPNRTNDKEIYLLSGTPHSVQEQLSLFLAIHELVSGIQGNFNLEKWLEDYCDEFIAHEGLYRPKNNAERPWGAASINKPRAAIVKPKEGINKDYTVVQFWPDKKDDEYYYWCVGTPMQIVAQVMNLTHQLQILNQKDIGEFLGWPIREYQALRPKLNPSLMILLSTKESPPFYKRKTDAYFFKAQIEISNVDTSKLTYANLRKLCNDTSGLVWGHWQARAYVAPTSKNTPIGQIVASGDDEPTALENLRRVCEFSKSKVLSKKATHTPPDDPLAVAEGNYELKKRYKIYPRQITILNPTKTSDKKAKDDGRATREGIIKTKTRKLWLYPPEEPLGWSEALKRALS